MLLRRKLGRSFFERVKARKKNVEFRLADFKISKGDKLRLREWNQEEKRYTGRSVTRTVKAVHRVQMFNFHPLADIKKYGVYRIKLQ